MKSKLIIFAVLLLTCTATGAAVSAAASDESEVRNSVQRIFDQLKAGQYEGLYDSLPSSTRSQIWDCGADHSPAPRRFAYGAI